MAYSALVVLLAIDVAALLYFVHQNRPVVRWWKERELELERERKNK